MTVPAKGGTGPAKGGTGPTPGWSVRRLVEDDWQLYRAVRLAMLLDAPDAYGSTFGRELAFGETTWRERTRNPAVIAVRDDGLPLGSATLYTAPGERVPELVAMWVAGHVRGSGVADALVDGCVDLATAAGCDEVRLHVMLDNPRAVAFYERAGFAFDGARGDVDGCDRMSRRL